jgi:hypothetical protein
LGLLLLFAWASGCDSAAPVSDPAVLKTKNAQIQDARIKAFGPGGKPPTGKAADKKALNPEAAPK